VRNFELTLNHHTETMAVVKKQKAKSAPGASRPSRTKRVAYLEPDKDLPVMKAEDPAAEYRKSAPLDSLAFHSSLPYRLMGCAQGFMSGMTDDEIKEMMVRDKYGL
jgi:hypothetical protein